MSWPGYAGGGQAPHCTVRAVPGKGIVVREHTPFSQHAKALMNLPGGVETNRRGVIQFELIGTCDPIHKGKSAWFYWPDADDVVLKALADYLRPIHAKYRIPAKAPKFLAYPSSYGGERGQRMSFAAWNSFKGICGHQHVPENDHGDPGAFPIDKLLKFLGGTSTPNGFLMALNDKQQLDLYNRVMGGIPAGSAIGRKDAAGNPARLLDTGDGGYLLGHIQAVGSDTKAIAAKVVAAMPAGQTVSPEALEAALRKVLGSVDNIPAPT